MKFSPKKRRSSFTLSEKLLFTAGVLFCLLLITTAMMGSLFARYTTGDEGTDSARVIYFGDIAITETGDFIGNTNRMPITPGVNINKKAVVTFKGSEASTYVFLEVSHTGGWTVKEGETGVFINADLLTWRLADGWTALDGLVFYRELAPNEKLSADIIKDGVIEVSASITNSQIDGLAGTIDFRASVVQSHGFENVQAAWASLQSKEVP